MQVGMSTTNVRLSEWEAWGHGISNVGFDLMQYWVNVYMMFYFTDILGVNPIYIAPLMMIVRVFDAVNDPIFGMIQDRNTKSKMGRYRPFLLFAGIASAVVLNIMFNGNVNWSEMGKVVFMYISYILVTVCTTNMVMAMYGLMCVITSHEESRDRMAARRMVCSNATAGFAGILAVQMAAHFSQADGALTQKGFTPTVMIFSLAAVATTVISFKSSKERIRPKEGESVSVKQSFSTLKGNRPALFAYVAYGLLGFIVYGIQTMFTYYYTYVSNDIGFLGQHGIVYAIGTIVGTYVTGPMVVKRVSNKKYGMVVGLAINGAMYIGLYFVAGAGGGPIGNLAILYWVMVFACFAGMGTFLTSLFTCFPDIADLGEYNTGVRADGFLSAIASFAIKFGGAFGPTIGASMLASAGYVANQVQNAETIQAIMLNISIIPGAVALFGSVFIIGYNLDKKRSAEVREELERRRAARALEEAEGENQA